MYSQKFVKDQEAWRRSRPEYAALVAAIKSEKSDGELALLAGDAGASSGEIFELQNLRSRANATHVKKRAAAFAKAKKEFDDLIEKIGETEKCLDLSKSKLERDQIEGTLYGLLDRRQTLNMSLADALTAHQCIETARAAGVL